MNYRHIYHAGNFADVLKHAVLALVIEHMKLKDQPFRVIDTHAGIGRYDLASNEAQKTGEWREGIGRILSAEMPAAVRDILAPYLDVVTRENQGEGELTTYPGSPLIARRLLRRGDTLVVNELHPDDYMSLKELFARDSATKVLNIDAWSALKSLLPPRERRGLTLVDPPFEEPGEFQRLSEGLAAAHRRFATGCVMLWYPIKDPHATRAFLKSVGDLGLAKVLVAELCIREALHRDILNGTGLVICNPPFTLYDKLVTLLPFLVERLALGPRPAYHLEWLAE